MFKLSHPLYSPLLSSSPPSLAPGHFSADAAFLPGVAGRTKLAQAVNKLYLPLACSDSYYSHSVTDEPLRLNPASAKCLEASWPGIPNPGTRNHHSTVRARRPLSGGPGPGLTVPSDPITRPGPGSRPRPQPPQRLSDRRPGDQARPESRRRPRTVSARIHSLADIGLGSIGRRPVRRRSQPRFLNRVPRWAGSHSDRIRHGHARPPPGRGRAADSELSGSSDLASWPRRH
eukprot:759510-Hanusia_phi.AAC.4